MGRAAEILFDPTLIGYTEERGVHHLILDAINKCDHYKRNRLYDAIYLVGGNCDINNFQQRLLNELKIKIANKKNKKNIKIRGQHLNKITTPFIGGTLIAKNYPSPNNNSRNMEQAYCSEHRFVDILCAFYVLCIFCPQSRNHSRCIL